MPIQIDHISHIYNKGLPDETKALDDISFSIEDGQTAAIIGHTGSGKSTLLQHLNGLLEPDSGSIIIDGSDITDKSVSKIDIRKKVGFVFQYPEYQLFEETVKSDVAFGPKNLGLSQDEIEESVKEAITLVGLDYDEIKDASPFELSGGQKRRVAIAGVIAMKPRILILDEPVAGLDPKAHTEILELIRQIHRTISSIIILVSHNMDDVAAIADKVLVMDRGRLVMQGTPEEIFARGEELEEKGLGLPSFTKFMNDLRLAGLDTEKRLYTLEQAADAVAEAVRKQTGENAK